MGKVLSEYIEKHKAVFANISEDAYDIISIMSKAQQPSELKQRYVTEGGKIDMCKAIDDMIRE